MDLSFFLNNNILESGTWFFKEILNINTSPAVKSGLDLKTFLDGYLSDEKLLQKVADARLIGMVNDNSLQGKIQKKSPDEILKSEKEDYDLILVFGIELAEGVQPTKSDISRLTRALNRRSASRPVVLLTRYSDKLTFSAAERGEYKRKGQKGEKIGRISILRDINLDKDAIHSGHERILLQLRVNPLIVTNFKELYDEWLEVFNISTLNKEFYGELFTWYLWAVKTVKFPNKVNDTTDDTVYNSENVIRLLTRLIFIWFVKEKKLIPNTLFDKNYLSGVLTKFNPISDSGSDYYKAILQNLFFATLNTEMPVDGGVRKFLDETKKNKKTGYSDEYMDHLSFRHKELFSDPGEALKMFENIPFLNGGLFECLDHRDPETDEEIRIDGFSSKPSKQPTVPNMLFFGTNNDLDLSSEFEDGKKHKHSKARGIINILNSYKFTIEENTPLEQEIALDPELLGKIFENLLASYNPETRTTARKQTGSYYTPREIVNYMVDESLIAYLKTKLSEQPVSYQALGGKQTNFLGNEFKSGQLDIQVELAYNKWKDKEEELEEKLHNLFSYEFEENPFNGDKETSDAIIAHLSECKILDPACGSGAFPMGILHKIVLALGKLDPCNYSWKQAQLDKAVRDRQRAEEFEDEALKNEAIKRAEEKIRYIEESFGDTGHELDYARKLFLIENCIYGVDIQQVAVQISKLRFFISLMVDQQFNDKKRNRNILSLPNLETKFVAANTLIPIEKPQQLLLKDPEVEKYEKTLQEIHHKIFYTRGYAEKKKLKKEELDTRKHLRKLYVDKAGYRKEAAEAITKWNPFDPLKAAPFFDPAIMFTLESKNSNGFFDILIGNPPYITIQRMDLSTKRAFQSLNYETFESTGDIYALFYERGHQLLKKNGVLTYITSRQWMQASYGKSLRKFLVAKTDPLQLIDFGQKRIFEGATVFVNILIFKNNKNQNNLFACLIPADFDLENNDLQAFFISKNQKISKLTENTWTVTDERLINEQIEKVGKAVSSWDNIEFYRGVTTGLNEAFHINEEIKNKLLKDRRNSAIIKPLLRGKDIKRYQYEFSSFYLIETLPSKEIDINKFPLIKEHLSQFKRLLEPKPSGFEGPWEGRKPGRYKWFENQDDTAYWPKFLLPKIVWIEISDRANYAFDDKGMYLTNSAYFLTCKNDKVNLKYLLAILNSKVADFYFSQKTARIAGGRMRYTKQYVEQIPIPEINLENQVPFVRIIEQILEQRSQNIGTEELENRVDIMANKLYSFSYEYCKIIDPQFETLISQSDYERMSIEELAEYEIPKKDKTS